MLIPQIVFHGTDHHFIATSLQLDSAFILMFLLGTQVLNCFPYDLPHLICSCFSPHVSCFLSARYHHCHSYDMNSNTAIMLWDSPIVIHNHVFFPHDISNTAILTRFYCFGWFHRSAMDDDRASTPPPPPPPPVEEVESKGTGGPRGEQVTMF